MGGPTVERAVRRTDRLEDLVLAVLRHEHPGGGHARLTGRHGNDLRGAGSDPVQGIGEIDLSRLAAELQCNPLHGRGGLGQDLPADSRRSGEGNHVHRRIRA